MAVDIACAAGAELLDRLGDIPGAALADHLSEQFGPLLVAAWAAAVTEDVTRDPLMGNGDDDELEAYGSTLLVGLLSHEVVALYQIGDGDIVVNAGETAGERPLPSDPRLVGNLTTSLCRPSAARDARVAVLDCNRPIELVMFATDGYGNSFADDAGFLAAATDMTRIVSTSGMDGIRLGLDDWTHQSARVAGDDVTVVVAARCEEG